MLDEQLTPGAGRRYIPQATDSDVEPKEAGGN